MLLHNMRDEIEHAAMLIEWLRRNDSDFGRAVETYLFTTALFTTSPITSIDGEAVAKTGVEAAPRRRPRGAGRVTIGSLKGT